MTSASVGFQCPECISAGRAATRTPTTALGGKVPDRPRVTYALIGINVAVYVLGMILSAGSSDVSLVREYGMWPVGIALGGEWWRLITAAFLHGGLLHIAFNMYVLFLLGPPLERVLGHVRYLTMYLLAALGGSVASYVVSPVNTVSVGASGAVFGLMAALLVVGRRFKHDVSQVAILLGINIVIGFIVPSIDWRAHLGGAATGAVVAAIMAYAPVQNRTLWQVLGVLAVLGVLVIVTMLRTAQLQAQLAQVLL